ncbi:AAA family ATPase [Candidatus Riflebacteria bacterium]
MKTCGLTLGKFAPLHHGHQFVIEQALKETEYLIVIIYDCPQITTIPLPVRCAWIKELYPKVEIIEAWDAPVEVGDTPELKQLYEEYILQILKDRNITHFFSSEFYGEHLSQALKSKNMIIDVPRKRFPISGSDIRREPFKHKKFISLCVYRTLIANIVFLGAPSTGKTTMAEELAKKYNTTWMPEYGREYWEQHQIERRLSLQQLDEIALGHIEREEEKLLQSNRYLFTDTNAITTYMFSLYYHGSVTPVLRELALASATRYDLCFLCEDDIPYDDTWDRSGDANRQVYQKQVVAHLLQRKIPFFRLRGNLDERIHHVGRILDNFDKFISLTSLFRN